MTTKTILRCDDCPLCCFVSEDDSEGFCVEVMSYIDCDIELGRPDWCPLNDGPIIITAGAP